MARTVRALSRPLPTRLRHLDQRALAELRRHHGRLPRLARAVAAKDRGADCARQCAGAVRRRTLRGYAAATSRRARLIRSRSRGEFIASHKSLRRCTFSQKSALLPNTRARMSAVGAVTALRLLHSSLTCLRWTPMAFANAPWVKP